MRKNIQQILILILFLAVITVAGQSKILHKNKNFKNIVPLNKSRDYNSIQVTRVIDGDTLQLESGERVRLIGIDCPESKYNPKLYRDVRRTNQDTKTIMELGRKAKAFTQGLVKGKRVRMELDIQPRDKYDRLLAYVFIPTGNGELFLNAYIVEQGYASLMTVPPNVKYAGLFKRLYRVAHKNRRGLWGEHSAARLFQ